MKPPAAIQSVGIIGLGSFGRFLASLVPPGVRILGFDTTQNQPVPRVEMVSLAEVAAADAVILAVPLQTLPAVLSGIKDLLHPDTVVVDVCSVKMRTEELIEEHLPGHNNILLTHPLFGPQSAAQGTKGHRLIVTKSLGDRAASIVKFCCDSLGLDIRRMDSSTHDAAMAQVHALTFFVARGLAGMNLRNEAITTPSYQMVLDLIGLDAAHSEDLFRTIQLGNPFAKDMREQLLHSLTSVAEGLTAAETSHDI